MNNIKPLIIAEIGTAHCGSISYAKELINASKESGADIAKFQIVIADEIVHPHVGLIKLPSGKIDIYKAFKKAEKPIEFYQELKEYCSSINIEFLASVFGESSLNQYQLLQPKRIKLASPELNYYELLKQINKTNLPAIISTGVSKLKDIDKAYSYLSNVQGILHCVTNYPATEESYNLNIIKILKKRYKTEIGVSDHSKDPLKVPLLAYANGATIIEKHITLNNKAKGLDDSFALTPTNFKLMTKTISQFSKIAEKNRKKFLIDLIGIKNIKKINGNGKKKLTKEEKTIYATTNRSWVANKKIIKNEILTKNNCSCLRCEKNHMAGKKPSIDKLPYSNKSKKDYDSGDGIFWY